MESPAIFHPSHAFQTKKTFLPLKRMVSMFKNFTVVGQYGTHIDAPIHFVEGGRWLDEIASRISFCHSMLSTSLKKSLRIQTLS